MNMNIGPSFFNDVFITARVDYIYAMNEMEGRKGKGVVKRTFDPGPEAFIIRLFRTSAGEHTVVATVPAAKLAVK